MKFIAVFLLILAPSAYAFTTLESTAALVVSTLEDPALLSVPETCSDAQSEARAWAQQHIQQLSNIPEANRESLYFMISTFQCRLNNWRAYKPFYDELFSRPEIQEAYPDALPQNQTDNGLFIRVLNPGQRITDDSPLSHLNGKTIEQVFGYEGDSRLFAETPAMASRQLYIVQPDYFTHQHTGRYNTGYHEFGHLLHLSLMSPNEYQTIERLYLERKAIGSFMDDYAAQSSAEYFAQGLEAYLSETKPGEDYIYHKHTKQQLKDQDPSLFAFIESVVRNSASGCVERISR
jgi:hypothetical protein